MTVSGPPLGLAVEISTATGETTRWDPAGPAGSRPRGIYFRTKRGDGFADAGCSLARRIDGEYVDLGLLRDVKIVGQDGSVAYEGRVSGLPRSLSDTHEVAVQAAGWMAHARDRKLREIYVDSDMSKWGPMTSRHKATYLGLGFNVINPATEQGVTPQVLLSLPAGSALTPVNESVYDARGIDLGELRGTWTRDTGVTSGYTFAAQLGTSEDGGGDATGTLWSASTTGNVSLTATAAGRAWAFLTFYGSTASGNDRTVTWTKLQLLGRHGLPRYATPDGLQGLYVSDIITDSCRRFAPALDPSGVQATTYPVAQAAYTDRIAPYDVWTALNAFHLWSLSVWEKRRLTYAPVDLSDYDWEVRLGDPGVQIGLQGDSTDGLANGIAVTFTDAVTGRTLVIDPTSSSLLADTSVENPANREGLQLWTELALSFPATTDMATQLGRAALAQFNTAKSPGTIRVKGHIRDRAGHLQPVWKVRADDRISVTNLINDRPRLIHETSYDHDSLEVQISVDAPAQRLDAVLDRIQSALTTAGVA